MDAQAYNGDTSTDEPRDNLDVAYSIIRPSEYIDLLDQVNLKTGFYEDEELRMQVNNVRKGLMIDTAFSKPLRDHAEQEAKVKLADEGFAFYDSEESEPKEWMPIDDAGKKGRTDALLNRGEEVWSELGDPRYSLSVEQAAAIDAKTGMAVFKPLPYQLAAVFHEMTGSKGARTQDNYFGRVNRHEIGGDTDQEKARSLLSRGGS